MSARLGKTISGRRPNGSEGQRDVPAGKNR